MGVRPPQQNDDETPQTIAFGIAALDDHLQRSEVTFPVRDVELLEALGNPSIPYDAKGSEIRLSEALDEVQRSKFETRQEFMNVLHPVFEAKREHANNSIVGQIRSILPF